MTAAVTPVSYPFEPVIAASKQLLYGVRPDASCFLSYENPTLGVGGSEALKAIQQDKKTPFGAIMSLRSGNCKEAPKGGQTI